MIDKKIYIPKGVRLPGLGYRTTSADGGGINLGGNKLTIKNFFTNRGALLALFFAATFVVYGLRLIDYRISAGFNLHNPHFVAKNNLSNKERPIITDRNGVVLAIDVPTPRLYANAEQILEPNRTALALSRIFPELKAADLIKRFASHDPYFIISSVVTPSEQAAALDLGEPGLKVEYHPVRIYPQGEIAAHVVGYLDGERKGATGAEAYIDKHDLNAGFSDKDGIPRQSLTLDIRVQAAIEQELAEARKKYLAKAAGAMVMDADSGEIVAMVSQPGFNPNDLRTLNPESFNRVAGGTYELGSVFKLVTLAGALDSHIVSLDTNYDVRGSLQVGDYTFRDRAFRNRPLSLSEIFTKSSNVGAVLVAQDLGRERQLSFFEKLGLLSPLQHDFFNSAPPLLPRYWRETELATAAFGHGYAVSPLQFSAAAAAIINGGWKITPSFIPNDKEKLIAQRDKIISEETSESMKYMLRQNVLKGSGRRANLTGYEVGGKTGTAEKVINGEYVGEYVFTSFLSAFPIEDPKYIMMVFLDEPKGITETKNSRTAGWNVAPVSGKIIEHIAPILGLKPTQKDGIGFAVNTMLDAAKKELSERRIRSALPQSINLQLQ